MSTTSEPTPGETLVSRLKARHDAELRNMIRRHAKELREWRSHLSSSVDTEYMTRIGKVPALPGVVMPTINAAPMELELEPKLAPSDIVKYSSSEEDGEIKSDRPKSIPASDSKGSVLTVMELQRLLIWQYRIIRMHQRSEYQDLRSEQLRILTHCWRKVRDEKKEAQDNKVFREAWARTEIPGPGPASRPAQRPVYAEPSQPSHGPYKNKSWQRPAQGQPSGARPRQQLQLQPQAVQASESGPPVVTHKLTENEYRHLKNLREAVMDSPWLTQSIKNALMDQWKKAHSGHVQLAEFVAELRMKLSEAQTRGQTSEQ